MKIKHLHQKMAFRSAMLFLLLNVLGMTNAFAANHDFTAVAPNGQTLYYKITSSSEYTVMVTHPNSSTSSNNNGSYHYANNPYYQFTRPAGNLIIPYYVEYNGISYSVTAIDSYAFGTTYSNNNACIGLTSVVIPSSVLSIGDKAFAKCSGITSVTISTSVTSIGSEVFRYCSNLVTVNFNATNCSSVGSNTWNGCTQFTTLNLGNTVTRIPSRGFQGATQLASVTIPKKVHTIGDYAFNGCTNLTNVTIANNSVLTTIAQCAFQSCSYLATINLPNTLASIGNYAFDGCSLLQSTTESQLLPNALETIGDYAFQNASTLAYIRIPNTVTSIGKYAFKSCTALNTVDFEATNCTCSGTQAQPPFYGCSALASVQVSSNVTQVPAYCFKDCTALTSLSLGNSLTDIGTYAFFGCQGDSIVLPASIENIGDFAFGNAFDQQLQYVESHNTTPPTIGSEAVFPAGQTIYVPMFSVGAYQSADNWSNYNIVGMYMNYEVTAIANSSEGGTVMGGGTFVEGDTCTLTATANMDYRFVNWTENGEIVSTEATYSFIVESDRTLVANFEMVLTNHWAAESYQNSMFMIGVVQIDGVEQASATLELGAFCNGECRGSALPEEDGSQWLYFMTIGGNAGDEITFRLYDHFLQQELNLYCFNVIPFEMYGLIGIEEPYEVQFTSILTISANVSPENAGTITGAGEYLLGSDVTLTANANEGYVFNSWTLDGEIVSTEPSYTFTVTSAMDFIANFDVLYSVSATVNLENAGSIVGTGIYVSGTEATLIATANEGYAFNSWILNGEVLSTEPSYTFTVTESVNLTANFDVVRSQQLIAGWNWWSANLEITLDDLKAALVVALSGVTNIRIKSQDGGQTVWNGRFWNGQLKTLDVAQMYKISVPSDCEITLAGIPVNPAEHPVTIRNGANWMGFPLGQSMLINNALAGFPAVSGDQIKSTTNNTVYVRGAWRGALSTFEPGRGYIFKSTEMEDRTHTFPSSAK